MSARAADRWPRRQHRRNAEVGLAPTEASPNVAHFSGESDQAPALRPRRAAGRGGWCACVGFTVAVRDAQSTAVHRGGHRCGNEPVVRIRLRRTRARPVDL